MTLKSPRKPPKKAQSRETSNFDDAMRNMGEIVAMQRRLRRSVVKLKSLNEDSRLLEEYLSVNATALAGIREIRENFEWALRQSLTDVQRKAALKGLHLALIVESEFTSETDTAH